MDERLRDAPDAEATIALPAPVRRRTPYAHLLDRQAAPADLAALGGLNPLVEAANPLLALVSSVALDGGDPRVEIAYTADESGVPWVNDPKAYKSASGIDVRPSDGALLVSFSLKLEN